MISPRPKLVAYYQLVKPGIIRGNLITAAAGFFLASQRHLRLTTGLGMAVGLALIIASACVTNNITDRRIDALMQRTKQRALVTKEISLRAAVFTALLFGTAGSSVLLWQTNHLTLWLAIFGWVAYVILYGAAKRSGSFSTLVGSISGALPPVIGYTAVTNRLDLTAGLLFILLVCWQMPHFYAISMYRKADYSSAGIPLLSMTKSSPQLKGRILTYILAFSLVCVGLAAYTAAPVWYVGISGLSGIGWLVVGIARYQAATPSWSKIIFRTSLIVILLQCILIAGLPYVRT